MRTVKEFLKALEGIDPDTQIVLLDPKGGQMNNQKTAHCLNCDHLKVEWGDWQDKDYMYYECTCPVECGRTQFNNGEVKWKKIKMQQLIEIIRGSTLSLYNGGIRVKNMHMFGKHIYFRDGEQLSLDTLLGKLNELILEVE